MRKEEKTYPNPVSSVYVIALRGVLRGANGDVRRCTSMDDQESASNRGSLPGDPSHINIYI